MKYTSNKDNNNNNNNNNNINTNAFECNCSNYKSFVHKIHREH
jgi:hypothetical protein